MITHTPVSYYLGLTVWQLMKMIETVNKLNAKEGGD